jgi:hypothetical protein
MVVANGGGEWWWRLVGVNGGGECGDVWGFEGGE